MFTRFHTIVTVSSLTLFFCGLIFGAVGMRFYQRSHVSHFAPMPNSEILEYFLENDPNPEILNFVRQLSDPSRVILLSPLVIRTFDDGKRFSVIHEKHDYVLVSELFGYADGEMQTIRMYHFEEGGANIRFTVARNAMSNEIMNIVYSFNESIVYVDRNGDGTWDIVRGTTLPSPVVPLGNSKNEGSESEASTVEAASER